MCVFLLTVRASQASGTVGRRRRPEDHFVSVGGLRLHYVDWGNRSAPPFVMLHGIDRVARTFDRVAPHFASRYHVIAMDLRGHGDSGWDPEGRYLVEDHVGDLEGLVRALGLRNVTLWGNSTGGRVVQVFAGLHPELVAAVIAEDVGPERPRSIADAYARRVKQEENGWAGPDELLAAMRASAQPLPEAVLEPYVRHGTKRREDGRLVWKRDPNLVKGFVETELWRYVRSDQGPHPLRARRPQHHRAGGNAGGAEESAAAGAHRHHARSRTLPERRTAGRVREDRRRVPEAVGLRLKAQGLGLRERYRGRGSSDPPHRT